jgi:hypothetical protein
MESVCPKAPVVRAFCGMAAKRRLLLFDGPYYNGDVIAVAQRRRGMSATLASLVRTESIG